VRRYARRATTGHIFLFRLPDCRVIDGGRGGNRARRLNHACAPNCLTVKEEGRVLIVASKNIAVGDELLIDYRRSLVGRRTVEVRRQCACRCGAPRCQSAMLA
jgi:SET domain-containing protein